MQVNPQMLIKENFFSRLPVAMFEKGGRVIKRTGVLAILMALVTGLSGYLLPFELLAGESASHTLAQTVSTANFLTSRLAVAQRQGRCRALNQHLGLLAKASNTEEAAAALKSLSLLTGEMMNAYPIQGEDNPDSRALPSIYSAEGRRAFHEARESLRYTLREVRGMAAGQAATRVSDQCIACHAGFMREGGAGVTLSVQGIP
jgi:cytochrome c556